jgi:DamX protein
LDDLLSTEELVDQLTSEAMAGRMVLLVGADPEAVSERLGLAVEKLIDFGSELLRFDALQFHTADTLLADLADSLGIDQEHVLVGLKVRGQTDNPLLMVLDNAECLAADARALLRQLATEAESGLGVIFGGEPDAEAALLNAGIPLSLVLETADATVDELPDEGPMLRADLDRPRPRRAASPLAGLTIPWRHLAAVLGLLLLVWLFWPDEGQEVGEQEVAVLDLPSAPQNLPEESPPDNDLSVVPAPPSEPATVQPEPEPAPVPAVEPPPAPEPVPPVIKPSPAPKPVPKPVEKPAPVQSKPALTGMAAELAYRNEDWLLAQPAERWVLQVAVATSEDGARAMLDRLGRERSAYYRARRDGRVVFVVLAGTWASRDQAAAGRDKLADEFRQRGPFPRELRAVHSEIIAVR